MTHLPDDFRWTKRGERHSPDISTEVIVQYLSGECTPDEVAAVEVWRRGASDDVITDLGALLRAYARYPEHSPTPGTLTDRINAIVGEGTPAIASGGQSPDPLSQSQRPRWWGAHFSIRSIAAVATATVTAALLLIAGWNIGTSRMNVRMGKQVSSYTTGEGERAHITLPDGSHVMLNVASHLEIPTNYGAGDRTVRLTGEALFTVQPRSGSPFVVMAGTSETRVLGTRFSVRHYKGDTTSVIAVADGKVVVRSTVLVANQEMLVSADGTSLVRDVPAERFLFTKGVLALNGAALRDVIPDLNRWFNVDIRLGDPAMGQLHLVGEYTQGSAGNLVEILELTFDVRVVRNGRVLTIYPKH